MDTYINLHSIESFGTLDGPGIRTVFFLQGCPLRCGYCHNPDTWNLKAGKSYSLDQVMAIVRRYKSYYGEEGGVTFSGGEPLLQAEALVGLVDLLHSEGIHVTIDTSGNVYSPSAKSLLFKADLVILDMKHTNAYDFKALTNGDFDKSLKTLAFLKDNRKHYWIRQVIVPTYNDHIQQIEKLINIADSPYCDKMELLAYHQHGDYKWQALGLKSPFAGYEPMKIETLKVLQENLNQKRIF